jgi:hypothetical protein
MENNVYSIFWVVITNINSCHYLFGLQITVDSVQKLDTHGAC